VYCQAWIFIKNDIENIPILCKQVSLRFVQQVLQKIGIRVLQRTVAKAALKWLPIVGALGLAGYAWWDTAQVGKTAKEFFEKDIEIGK
jgi:hypothetical protein